MVLVDNLAAVLLECGAFLLLGGKNFSHLFLGFGVARFHQSVSELARRPVALIMRHSPDLDILKKLFLGKFCCLLSPVPGCYGYWRR